MNKTSSTLIENVKTLTERRCDNYSALHGSSFNLIEQLLKSGSIQQGGNFENFFYLLANAPHVQVNIEQSAEFYAEMNAAKDLLFTLYPKILATAQKNDLSPYLYTVGLSNFFLKPFKNPVGFEIFSDMELNSIQAVVDRVKSEDRRGIIVYFNETLMHDFQLEEVNSNGQTRILLEKPLTIDYICGIKLLGKYEQDAINNL